MNNDKKRALCECVLFLVYELIIVIFGNLIMYHLSENGVGNIIICIFSCVFQMLGVLVIYIIFMIFKDKEYNLGFSKEKIPLQIIYGVVLFVGMVILYKLQGNTYSGQPFEVNTIMFLFMTDALATAIGEEFAFRGMFYTRLGKAFNNDIAAILVSSLIFGLSHFMVGDIDGMLLCAVTGVLLCTSRRYLKNCTLVSTITAHFLYDFLMAYLAI